MVNDFVSNNKKNLQMTKDEKKEPKQKPHQRRKSLRDPFFPIFRRSSIRNNEEVYLDNNATTMVLDPVAEVASNLMQISFGNPSSSHIAGVRAKHLIESSRALAAEVIGCEPNNIIFTSGATEGIQTAIVSTLLTVKHNFPEKCNEDHYLLYGATEHKAVPNTLQHWNHALQINATILAIPVDLNGLLDLEFIARYSAKSLMICTMAVNNETGVFQDLSKLEQVIRQSSTYEVPWMVDCVQALAKTDLCLSQTSINYAPFSGHKLYAPKGVGLLYVREDSPCTPFIAGGGQESGIRSGTENTPGIAAFGKVFSLLLEKQLFKTEETLKLYRQQLADTLTEVFPGIVWNHSFKHSVPTTLNFSVKGVSSKEVMDLFDAAAIRVSAGSACSSSTARSFVLDAMGVPSWQSESAIRLSFGPATSQDQIDYYCTAIRSIKPALAHCCLVLSDSREMANSYAQSGLIELRLDDHCCWVYIDSNSKQMLIIDPLAGLVERLSRWVECQHLSVMAVIETHQSEGLHSCATLLRNVLSYSIPKQYQRTDECGWPLQTEQDSKIEIGGSCFTQLTVGDSQFVRFDTPGVAQSCFSLLMRQRQVTKIAIVGRLLQPGCQNKCAFPNEQEVNLKQYKQSLTLLRQLVSDDCLLGCSYDPDQLFFTTLALAMTERPMLTPLLCDEQKTQKNVDHLLSPTKDSRQPKELKGLVQLTDLEEKFSLPSEVILEFLRQNEQAVVLDLREAYESDMADIKSLFNLSRAAINVPLTKLTEFIMNSEYGFDTPMLLVCRTGKRSILGCQVMERVGYKSVYSIVGGIALYNSQP